MSATYLFPMFQNNSFFGNTRYLMALTLGTVENCSSVPFPADKV